MVFYLERLRYINEELWSISDAYITYEKCPELMEYDFTERSLHNTLSNYGHVPSKAKRHLTIRKADDYESFNLGLRKRCTSVRGKNSHDGYDRETVGVFREQKRCISYVDRTCAAK